MYVSDFRSSLSISASNATLSEFLRFNIIHIFERGKNSNLKFTDRFIIIVTSNKTNGGKNWLKYNIECGIWLPAKGTNAITSNRSDLAKEKEQFWPLKQKYPIKMLEQS